MITRLLTGLLILQLALVAALYWPKDVATERRVALISELRQTDVARVAITDGEGNSVELTREGDAWRMQSGLPVASAKVETLLRALLAADPGYAIAQSEAAAARFKVARDDFERRIELGAGVIAYLGSSPSYRKIHARRDGDNAVFVLDLNSFDAPTGSGDWLDRSLLARRELAQLSLYGIDFTLIDGSWSRSDAAAVDEQAMERLLQALASLQVTGVVATADEDLANAAEVLRITLGADAMATRLTVLQNSESERFYLQSSAYTQTFDTSAYDADRLIDAARTLGGVGEPEDAAEKPAAF